MNKVVGKKLQNYAREWQGRMKVTQKASSLDSGRRSGESGKGRKKMKRIIMALAPGALLLALTATVAQAATRYGTNGDDLMYGGYGNDFVYGRDEDDNLYGRYGYDEMSDGNGDDYINVKGGKRDRVWCSPGRDSFTSYEIYVVRDCEVPAILRV
jgi:Ca2+-binding RTX toxin-like protein